MTSRYSVTLNGNSMSAINSNLLILDVSYEAPDYGISILRNAGNNGARVTGRYNEMSRVTITFELHIYDIVQRQTACQDVVKWAKNGGTLVINDRPNQRLKCLCSEFPVIGSALRWTEPLSITFVAYEVPWWEDSTATTQTTSGNYDENQMNVPGNAGDARVSATVTANASVTFIELHVGDTMIRLENLSLSENDVVSIGYDERQLLYIKKGNTSLMSKRTPGSSDELLAVSGTSNDVTSETDGSITVVFSVRGCWM